MCNFSWPSSLRTGGWVAGMRGLCVWRIAVNVGDWTSLQVGDLLGFVEPSFVWSGSTTWPDPNNIAWFLMRDLLRLSPWEIYYCHVFVREKNCSRTLYFSLIIVKSLQLCGRRQIAEPRKYCLVRVIVFFFSLVCVFSIFLFLTGWEFGLIPYKFLSYWNVTVSWSITSTISKQ